MEIKILKPRKAINKAFLKIKPNRTEIESFKANLIKLLDKVDEIEREENQKTGYLRKKGTKKPVFIPAFCSPSRTRT